MGTVRGRRLIWHPEAISDFFNKSEVTDYFDNYFDFKYSLEDLLGRTVDLLEEQTVKNPYLKRNVDATKALIYG